MDLSKQLKALSHHAYLLIGGDATRQELLAMLEKQHDTPAQANPDFYDRRYQSLTIDDAREIKSTAETRPIGSTGKKVFVLTMNSITVEAQNALLKLLEEPPEYAHFFLIVPSAHLLLPTVKSRLSFIGNGSAERKDSGAKHTTDDELSKVTKKFVTSSKIQRLETVKKLMEQITKEKKTKQDAIDLLNAIQAAIYEEKGAKTGKSALEAIEVARKYANDRAPSMKMLLEYVALNI
jgi:DNA polymerase III delta prime subunit